MFTTFIILEIMQSTVTNQSQNWSQPVTIGYRVSLVDFRRLWLNSIKNELYTLLVFQSFITDILYLNLIRWDARKTLRQTQPAVFCWLGIQDSVLRAFLQSFHFKILTKSRPSMDTPSKVCPFRKPTVSPNWKPVNFVLN